MVLGLVLALVILVAVVAGFLLLRPVSGGEAEASVDAGSTGDTAVTPGEGVEGAGEDAPGPEDAGGAGGQEGAALEGEALEGEAALDQGLEAPAQEGDDHGVAVGTALGLGTQALHVPTEVPAWAQGVQRAMVAQHVEEGFNLLARLRAIGPWIGFMSRGKDLGFRWGELSLLYKGARLVGLEHPHSLLWSPKTLDRCLQGMLWNHVKAGTLADPKVEDFMYRLFRYRQTLEMGRPRYRVGISSTRSIKAGQVIKIIVPQVGMFFSRVTAVNRSHLEIDLPRGRPLPSGQTWKNAVVEVYFWRKDDAGYFFDTKITNAPERVSRPMLHMLHSESLIRTQKRASFRLQTMLGATLEPLQSPAEANEVIGDRGGFRCRIKDISETGMAVLIKGKLDPGFFVKIQTELNGFPVAMCGEIKSVNVSREKRMSLLHVEAIPLSKAMRIRVLAYVLGITRVGEAVHDVQGGNPEAESESGDPVLEPGRPVVAVANSEDARPSRSRTDLEELKEE